MKKVSLKDFFPKQLAENYKYSPNIPAHVLLTQISNTMADLQAKNILAKVAKMNPDAKRKVKEVDRIITKAIKAVDELSDMV